MSKPAPKTLKQQAVELAATYFMATSNDCVTLTRQIMRIINSARMVELDLLEQAINAHRDMQEYKLMRLDILEQEWRELNASN